MAAGTEGGSPDGRGAQTGSGSSGTGLGDEIRQLVRDKAYEQIGSQKQKATTSLGTIAGAVRGMTQQLNDSGQSGLAGYVTRAADEIDRWSSRLKDQDLDDAMRDLQDFARRKPAIFLGAAFSAGLLVARFLKSSNEPATGGRSQPSSWQPSSGAATMETSVAHDTRAAATSSLPSSTPGA